MDIPFTPIEKCASSISEELIPSDKEREVLFPAMNLMIKTTVLFWDHQFYTVIIKNEACSYFT